MQIARRVLSRIAYLTRWDELQALRGATHRRYATAYKAAATHEPPSIEHFREVAFAPERPLLIPRLYKNVSTSLPAMTKWFRPSLSATAGPDNSSPVLNQAYLAPHASAIVSLELTTHDPATGEDTFTRLDRPLSDFLTYLALREQQPLPTNHASGPTTSLYLAQHPLAHLPSALQADLPTPFFVAHAGRGDVYASSLWLGLAPTATPLHRDPNPNLLVQLAGCKRVRMLAPALGDEVFRTVRARLGQTAAGASVRGTEMMVGAERAGLDTWVWGAAFDEARGRLGEDAAWEGSIEAGGAVFIPRGWWHGVRGEGQGITGSVNWWFR